ncbi:hypothetical protein [Motilimonas sp. E26]|uniref:hypothetical protein n=1 Tax=Motilimonas sp. E26 TaxID=2865674 RepID=UPI001E36CD72|nr:hypothetical protein [Motilimonas sp. E26]MCE0558384.1 hypothetical protein [Motilimonas sp. E26]
MTDFTETMRRKGKAEEDIYFARLDQQLIELMHQKQGSKHHEKNESSELLPDLEG